MKDADGSEPLNGWTRARVGAFPTQGAWVHVIWRNRDLAPAYGRPIDTVTWEPWMGHGGVLYWRDLLPLPEPEAKP